MGYKIIFLFFLCIMSITLIPAAFDLEIEKIDKGSVIIIELENPAIYEFIINNKGPSDNAEIYSLVGFSLTPKGTFNIPAGKSTIEVIVYPPEEFKKREGVFSFEYQIKGASQGIFEDELLIRIVSLNDVFSIEPVKIHPNDSIANITIKNNVNANLENVNIHLSSKFFDSEETIDMAPFGTANLAAEIKKDKILRLIAGQYPITAEIGIGDESVKFEGTIDYLEKEGISVIKQSSGFIVREQIVTKVNEGNVPVKATIELKKDIISRLFNSYTIAPLSVERTGLVVEYLWEEELQPGESLTVVSTTNYTFPFVLIGLIILVALLVRIYTLSVLSLNKKVSIVKTKSGEFALKVSVRVKARRPLSNIEIIDKLPHMAQLYEKFGRKPDRIDEQNKRLFWNINFLNRGEERIFSYIIYSKLRAVGRFELPAAVGKFESNGEKKEVYSNKAYFVSETSRED